MKTLIKTTGKIPQYQKPGDAAVDLHASKPASIPPGHRAIIHTGIYLALPDGYCADIKTRSGMAAKSGVIVANADGLIDAGYRGEIMVILLNTSDAYFDVSIGDRIAQMELRKVERFEFELVDELPETERGAGGLGSTGL